MDDRTMDGFIGLKFNRVSTFDLDRNIPHL